jgi:hypothetical protein
MVVISFSKIDENIDAPAFIIPFYSSLGIEPILGRKFLPSKSDLWLTNPTLYWGNKNPRNPGGGLYQFDISI